MWSELVEKHLDIVFTGVWIGLKDLFDAFDKPFDFFNGRVVSKVKEGLDLPVFAQFHIVDGAVYELTARDGHEGIVERPDPRAAKADFLDGSLDVFQFDPMAYGEGLLEHDDEGAEQIGEGLLRRQGDRKAADPETGDHRVGGQAYPVGSGDEDGNRRDDGHEPNHQADKLAVDAAGL